MSKLGIISQVQMIKLGHFKAKLYFFTKQIKGKNLDSWCKRQKQPPEVFYEKGVLKILQYSQENNKMRL